MPLELSDMNQYAFNANMNYIAHQICSVVGDGSAPILYSIRSWSETAEYSGEYRATMNVFTSVARISNILFEAYSDTTEMRYRRAGVTEIYRTMIF